MGLLAIRLQRRTNQNAVPLANPKIAARGPQNGRRGLERKLILCFWALQFTLAKLFL